MQTLENLALKKYMKDHLMYVYMQQKLLLKIIQDIVKILLCCIYVYCKGILYFRRCSGCHGN